MASINPPKGWTTDPDQIEYEIFWAPKDSDGQYMAREFGLKDPKPIMVTTPDTGVPAALFQSEDKFYFLGQLENGVYEIIKPKTLDMILQTMTEKGQKAVKTKELKSQGRGDASKDGSASINPPKGWTTDPDQIEYEIFWAPEDSDGQYMAREFGLKDPKPIMEATPDTGAPDVLFQSENKFYFWNQVENSVHEIVKPKTLDMILQTMIERGEKAVKSKELKSQGRGDAAPSSKDGSV